jgi:hypothetical protein
MSVILQATGGPATGMKINVPRGQVAQVGRTKWADHCIANDASLANVHFVIDFVSQDCRIRDMSGGSGTLVNGTKIAAETHVHTGDSITAGQCTFSVLVEGESPPSVAAAVEAGQAEESPAKKKTARYYANRLDLSDDAISVLQVGHAPAEYLDALTKKELYADALRFLAYWLIPQAAVSWGCQSLLSVGAERMAGREKDAFEAARQWSSDPSEKNRRKAESAADAAKYDGPGSYLALAAFWSGGSLAPEGLAEVPPAEGLTAQGVTAALLMAASQGGPAATSARYRRFLELGKKMALEQSET